MDPATGRAMSSVSYRSSMVVSRYGGNGVADDRSRLAGKARSGGLGVHDLDQSLTRLKWRCPSAQRCPLTGHVSVMA